jgi:flagellar hook assembly protein FlgD
VALEVYDVAGRRVFSRELGTMPAGWREVSFAGRDRAGALLPSGVYFYRITAGRETMTRKMVISR